jgi:hypothetical protein
MNFDEKSILSTMDPILVIIGFIVCLIISNLSSRRYRDTNDSKKSIICSMTLFIILGVFLFICDFPFFLILGYGICTFIFTLWFSNYYFYN